MIKQILEEINESAGNLKSLPKGFLKRIMGYSLGGKHSEIELFKSKAKQKDVTAAAKHIGGYVKPSEKSSQYSFHPSTAERAAKKREEEYVAAVVKEDGAWQFLVEYDDYNGKFGLIGPDGKYATVKGNYNMKAKRSFDTSELTATNISEFIDFSKNIEVFLITADKDRIQKRNDRQAQKNLEKPKFKSAAMKRILKSKVGPIVDDIKKDIDKELERLKVLSDKIVENAFLGNQPDTQSFETEKIQEKMRDIIEIGKVISDVAKNGMYGERWRNESPKKTFYYDRFLSLVKELEKENFDD